MSNFSHYVFHQKNQSKIISKQTYQKILNDNQQEQCFPATIQDVLNFGHTKELKELALYVPFNMNLTSNITDFSHYKIEKGSNHEIISKNIFFKLLDKEKELCTSACIKDIMNFGNKNLKKIAMRQNFNAPIKVDENDLQLNDVYFDWVIDISKNGGKQFSIEGPDFVKLNSSINKNYPKRTPRKMEK